MPSWVTLTQALLLALALLAARGSLRNLGLPVLLGLTFLFGYALRGGESLLWYAILVFMVLLSVYLQRQRPPGRFWAGPLLALLWLVPAGLLVLLAMGVPLAVVEGCSACTSRLKNLAAAVEMYHSDHGEFPVILDRLQPDYLPHPLRCPHLTSPRARVFYRYRGLELADGYGYRRTEHGYLIWCRSSGGFYNHTGSKQPWYSDKSGAHDDAWFPGELSGPERLKALARGPSGP